MPLWRDPLDELIESLETNLLPDTSQRGDENLPRLVDLQMVTKAIVFGTDEDRYRMRQTPLYREVMGQLARSLFGNRQTPVRTDRATEGSEIAKRVSTSLDE